MKWLLSINHPAWVYQFLHLIRQIHDQGDELLTLVVEKDGNTDLLKSFGIPYRLYATSTGRNVLQKGILFLWLSIRYTWAALQWKPDIVIGRASPMLALAAWITRKPHLLYEDTEVSKFSLRICKRLSTEIITPSTFLADLGEKQKRMDTYKELFYLHPSVFTPNKQLLRDAGFNPDEAYILLRFVAWNASHDFGKKGLDNAGKLALARRLQKYGRVYVSDEGGLSEALKPYALQTPYALIHHVLAFARLVYSEGATMASESAVLGTHALYVNTIISGSTREQSERYQLLYNFNEEMERYELAAQKAEELLEDPLLAEKGLKNRERLLLEKTDIYDFFFQEAMRLAVTGRKG